MVAALLAIGVLAGCGGAGTGDGRSASADSARVAPPGSVRSNETPVATGSSGRAPAAPADTGGRGVGNLPPGSSVDRRPVEGRPLRVVFIGTSLTAGLGLPDAAQEAWPAQIGKLAAAAGEPIDVVNAGLSGETSAGALRRVNWLLRDTADVIVIETGANDGLRGLPVADLEKNLRGMVAQARARQPRATIVLVPMEAPPNIGGRYATDFRGVYAKVASDLGLPTTPFLLDGVAGVPAMNQADGIHPTERGAARAARNVWPALSRILAAHREGRGAV
jgi:acyl-CoA thioesterase-1